MLVMKSAKRLVKKFLVKFCLLQIVLYVVFLLPIVSLKKVVLCDLDNSDYLHKSSVRITLEMGHLNSICTTERIGQLLLLSRTREKNICLFTLGLGEKIRNS